MAKKIDAAKLLELVGGKGNVSSVTHCMTRLRVRMKDESLAHVEEIDTVEGVIGTQKNTGELQIIIGPKVDDVYQDFIKIGDFKLEIPIIENMDGEQKKTFKSIMNTVFGALTGCISPVVYAFITMGMFKSISAIFGPSMLGLFTAESDIYILLEGISSAITYFIPFLLAYSASIKLGANTTISLVLAAILVSPTITGIATAGEPFKVFGLFPMTLVNYTSSFLPIIMIVAVQVYVEKFLNKVIPSILKAVFIPTLTVAIMTVLGLCVLGPVGQWLGTGLADVVMWLSESAGWLEGALICGLYVFLVAFGLGGPVFLATFTIYTATGTDYLYFPFMVIYGMVLVGVSLGYVIKSKNADEKQTGLVALTSQLIGGVSEPTIYGILFRNKICLCVEIIAATIAGFYCGLTHTAVSALTMSVPVVGPFLSFSGISNANMINGCISAIVGFLLGFIGVLLFFKEEKN